MSAYHITAFDFVATREGEFVRVNVKLASEDNNGAPLITRSSKSNTKHNPDLYLVYFPSTASFAQVAGAFLYGKKSRRIRPEHHISLL